MKKIILILFLLFSSTVANAMDKNEKQCIRGAVVEWSKAFNLFWTQIEVEMKKANPAIYSEFQYLIQEQKNYNRLTLITLDYLLDKHPAELKLNEKVSRVVPGYFSYFQKIHRELRKIKEYDRLYLENQSYSHNIKNPNFERLQKASQLIEKIKEMPKVILLGKKAISKGDVLLSDLNCVPNKK